ncbi:glycerophosphodiester phosphodiesterase family protein [Pedobacter heparinus]|uniref:Glycerophosphoryl diester phosphodiesterase n=1 Tax=Pedobacter heparinus (strain ATCC 13125 / DSM 2366 / CIP 104194 / JCM 7457 / NBRC 12017 / NCIMB 9290 / NRRL B-14731 / HIM 762-3) TaxID=485917 RepID=C6Y016_PEDHD|nr:glycerophosphodiester phosphodiesterase family protein [Pedobacter heparinus]ACU02711.1 glycerophosphoryl diester phosphodiesterase [Pedobacter heparinus DSM 2366]
MKKILLTIILGMALQAQAQKFMLIGHQGARGIMPENTIPGMIKALDLDVNVLNMGVVISKDGEVVLSHEPYFNNEISTRPDGKPITFKDEKKYNMFEMDYEEIRKFDVGTKVHNRFPGQMKMKVYKPLLAETIDSVEAYVKEKNLEKPVYCIETSLIRKGDGIFQPDATVFIEKIMEIIKEKKLSKRVIIQSLDMRTLQYLHEYFPSVKTALMIDEKQDFEESIQTLGFTPTYYSPYYVLVGKGLVDRCHAAGVKIIPWTVNTAKDMKYLINLGVDGIITDYPNQYTRVMQEQ